MKQQRLSAGLLVAFVCPLLGCGAGESSPSEVERHGNARASVDEGLIRAAIAGDSIAVDVPVRLMSAGTLDARIIISIATVATGQRAALAWQTASIHQTDEQ